MIYLKFHQNFLKNFATFIPESFPKNSTNFSENFLKNLVKISIKLYLRIAQILVIVYPKIFSFFLEFSQISIKILSHQHSHNQLNMQNFQKFS